jgi:hypothetical protein
MGLADTISSSPVSNPRSSSVTRPTKKTQTQTTTQLRLCLLFGGCCLGLCGLLPAAANHHDAEERANNCRAQEREDDGDADCPDARREEVMERMALVDKWLLH